MRWLFQAAAICSGLALASCQEPAPLNEDELVDIVALLKSGDPAVCAMPEVQELALNIAEPNYEKFKADGGQAISFQAISATAVNKDIHEVACSANMMAYSGNLLEGVDIGPVSIRTSHSLLAERDQGLR